MLKLELKISILVTLYEVEIIILKDDDPFYRLKFYS